MGLLFAWCASARVREGGPWSQPALAMVASFVAIILVPCTAYLYLAHPDWCWMYLVDASKVPRLFVVPIVAVTAAAVVGGYYGGARIIRHERLGRFLTPIVGGSGVLVLAIGFAARGRLLHYGATSDYRQSRALPLLEVKLGYVLIAMLAGVVAATVFVGWELWRDGRRAAAMRDGASRPTPRDP